ncbi:MAG: long-chain fatty acid--CoA ligase [Ignavibacteriaceae bacterium]
MLIHFRTIPDLFTYLTNKFRDIPDKCIMHVKENGKYRGITYKEFEEQTDNFASGLLALGIKKGDKIAISSENRPEWVYSDMAILGLGGIDVPLYPSLTAESQEFILNNSEAAGIIVSNKFQLNKILKIWHNCKKLKHIIVLNENDIEDKKTNNIYSFKDIQEMGKKFKEISQNFFKENIKSVSENDICTIIYTSGTTGDPKGVILTHKNIISNVQAVLDSLPISSTDIFLSFLPLCHIFERMGGYYTGFACEGTVYYAESIEMISQNILEVKPTIITTVPRLFERIYSKIIKNVEKEPAAKQKIFYWAVEIGKKYSRFKKENNIPLKLKIEYKLAEKLVFSKLKEKMGGRLRFFVSGGAPLSREMGIFFEAIGIIILEGYGLTESSPVITANRADDYKFGTVGKVMPGVQVKIASDGEILVKGPNVMQGYYKNKSETNETIKDGWLHTGDIGVFDSDGFLMITDRKKHLFKTSGGKYIAPAPIENLFLNSKYIDQFMLIGNHRMFLSALIVPDFESIQEYADSHKIGYSDIKDLINKKEIYDLVDKEISHLQKKLANYEKVRKFRILDKPFTIESGEITPSLKIKRKFVEERYAYLIEGMYFSGMDKDKF